MKKKFWIVFLIVGIIPFIIPIISGIYYSRRGYSVLCWWQCDYYYGFNAFIDSIILYSYILWPTYIIGIVIIVLSIIKLKNKK